MLLFPHLKMRNKEISELALAGVAQCWPTNQRVAGSIPSQGTCLVIGQVPRGWGWGA